VKESESNRDAKPSSLFGLNPRNTFESFVIGPNNEIAHRPAWPSRKRRREPQSAFHLRRRRPRKTHLMQAIGQYVLAKKKNTKVIYLSSELFINEFIDAIQHNNLVKFRKRYRQADLLCIDDIQFLAGKERSQEEFFTRSTPVRWPQANRSLLRSAGVGNCQPRASAGIAVEWA